MPATAKQKLRAKRLAQLKRFLREHTWGVMITGLILIALILFVCVIAGAAPKEAPAPETTQDETPRYESGLSAPLRRRCRITPKNSPRPGQSHAACRSPIRPTNPSNATASGII